VLNFYRSAVKHDTQNIKNDCHQWLSDSFRTHQIRFCTGALPWTPLGELKAFPLYLKTSLRGPASKEEGRERRGKRRGEGDRKERGGTDFYANSLIRPWLRVVLVFRIFFSF